MIPIDFQVSRSKVKVIGHVCLRYLVKPISQECFAPEAPPPLKKEWHIALHMSVRPSVGRSVCQSVGMSVSLNLVQLITQEGFDPEASNLVGR